MFQFDITAEDTITRARVGKFHTPHGSFETPCFMPCGTKGAVKTLTPDELKQLGCEIMLANTYHLMLRPGGDIVEKMGGLHKWIAWDKPILTDSGGFQIFSLSKSHKIHPRSSGVILSSEQCEREGEAQIGLCPFEGATRAPIIDDSGAMFQSHIDGSTHVLTPEKAIAIQEQLGADIIMALDECAPGNADHGHAKEAMKRTHDWVLRSFKAKKRADQALFPIVQGATFTDLRKESAKFMAELNAHGIAIGGVAVGEPKPKIWEVVETVEPILPKEKPRYLMGVGEPADIVEAVSRGMDMFDCVLPTRLARHGSFWTQYGRENITKSAYAASEEPLEKGCGCYTCAHFSKSYLRHLMIEKEILGHRLLTIHNLHFLLELLRKIRKEIANGTFEQFRKNFVSTFYEKSK